MCIPLSIVTGQNSMAFPWEKFHVKFFGGVASYKNERGSLPGLHYPSASENMINWSPSYKVDFLSTPLSGLNKKNTSKPENLNRC